jgi:hypothetical protein
MAAAQSAVEYTLGAGRSAGAAGGLSKVAKRVADVTDRAAGQIGKSTELGKWTPPKPAGQAEPKPKFEEPSNIAEGIPLNELLRRFGEPEMKVSASDAGTKYWYGSIMVIVRNDKVASVSKPEPPKPEAAKAGLVVIQ